MGEMSEMILGGISANEWFYRDLNRKLKGLPFESKDDDFYDSLPYLGVEPEPSNILQHFELKNEGSNTSMIKQPNELLNKEKKIRMLIAGYPGIGKSTLGLSAPNALHIDVDFGADRIEPRYRRPFIQPKSYDEILSDLTPLSVANFDTLVFDTGGKLLDLMKPWAIKQDPKNGKRDGTISLAGYGAIGREFVRLMDYCFYELDKHIVVLFHAIEEKDGESTKLRLMVEGGTRNTVWIPMDLGGYMEMYGNDRTLGLSNCERYYAKGTRGIKGVLRIPELNENIPNDFLAKLFNEYNAKSKKETTDADEKKIAYEEVIAEGQAIINGVTNIDTANSAIKKCQALKHVLTSSKELSAQLGEKAKTIGLFYDRVLKMYTAMPKEKGAK